MYVPSQFEQNNLETLHALMRAHPLATWVTRSDADIIVNHIPFFLDRQQGEFGTLRAHVARANPVWKTCSSHESVVIFHGPQSYISPSWYPAKRESGRVVPAWNYVVVHAHGTAKIYEDRIWLLRNVSELSDAQEHERADPWRVSDAPGEYIDRLLGAIVGIEIPIARLVGKWKASQHRPPAETAKVIDELHAQNDSVASAMAAVMHAALP